MDLHLLGARGSIPCPGAGYLRYGGNTSCIAVARPGAGPRLLLDAGSGIRNVGPLLGGRPFHGTVVLTHLHWDHTQGLPFFRAGDRPDAMVKVLLPDPGSGPDRGPPGGAGGAEAVLEGLIQPPYFPIRPAQLQGRWTFGVLDEGWHRIDGFDLLARQVPHKGGRTFGYRISDGSHTVAFVPDHGPAALGPGPDGFGPYHEAILALAGGADVLIHDAHHSAEEFPAVAHFGHSTVDYAMGLAAVAGVRSLVLFHHDPNRSDDALDILLARHRGTARPFTVRPAVEGEVIKLA